MARTGELARARAFHGLSEAECQLWFGVGPATLERIEAGEVEPDPELDHRINRFLNLFGAAATPSLPGRPLAHDGRSPGAGSHVAPGASANFGDHA